MEFGILAVRTTDEDDGRLYPLPGGETAPVRMEQWDGEPLRIAARALSVKQLEAGHWSTHQRLRDVNVDVLVTESRVVVSCSRYRKGGGWVGSGGTGLAPAANGVSRARAARRLRGRMLVGQVRYPWLRCVGFRPTRGWGSSEELRLGVLVRSRDGDTRHLFLDIELPKGADSAAVARIVLARAARYRLSYTDVEDDDQGHFRKLAEGSSPCAPGPREFTMCQLPSCYFVSTTCAYPEQAASLANDSQE